MPKPSIGNQDALFLGKALQAMLDTAFSPDNFGTFLDKTLKIMADSAVSGTRPSLAIILKAGRVRQAFRGFKAADRARLASGLNPAGVTRGRLFSEPVCLGNKKAGRITILLSRQPPNPLAVRALLGLVAQFVGARLQGEERDAELARERDIASSVKHVEELYLSFPGISIEEISRAVLDEARRMTGSEYGVAGYLSEDRKKLVVAAMTREAMTVPPPPGRPVVLDSGFGLLGCVVRKKKPLISNRAQQDRRAARAMFSSVHRFMGVPATVDRRLVGVLSVSNAGRDYGPGELDMLEKLGRVYAMVLQRKFADDRRREEDTRFKTIVSSTKDTIYTADLTGRLTYVSPMASEYGYTPEELIGRSVIEFAHPDDKDFITKAWANAVRTGRTLPILPYRLRRKDGTYAYCEQKSGIVFQDGRPLYITGVLRDVTEVKRTERMLKESEETLRMMFDTAEDAIFIKDMNGIYVQANKAFAARFGLQPEQVPGKRDADLYPPEVAGEIFREDSEVVRTGRPAALMRHRVMASGDVYLNTIKTPLRNVAGEIIGVLGISRDITALKKMESELAVARAAEAVSKVARPMAHDFNNALAAINGYATLIDDGLTGDNPIKPEIAHIIKAVGRAAELMSKFQDFARNPDIKRHEEKEKK